MVPSGNQLLDEVEQNIVICQWRVDQLFADAELELRDHVRFSRPIKTSEKGA